MHRVTRLGIIITALVLAAASATAMGQGTPPDGVIADDITIQGVDVGGLTVAQARERITGALVQPRMAPMRLSLRGRVMTLKPAGLGYAIQVNQTLLDAMAYGRTRPLAAADVPLRQSVDRKRLVFLLRYRESLVRTDPRDARRGWRGQRPRIIAARAGYAIKFPDAANVVTAALLNRTGATVALPARPIAAANTRIGMTVVVNRAKRKLTLYSEERRIRTFPVAVGTPAHPTPSGTYRVIQKQKNPTWFPPDSPWAAGLGPVPPGPGNPLGTRWIGTSAPAIGIHGTPASWSIGTAASHGCIRMHIPDVEWLYNYVQIGTTVRFF